MIVAGIVIGGILVAWLAYASWIATSQQITFHQGFIHAPLALLRRVDSRALRGAPGNNRVIYVVSHQSALDPALMLALLPDDTLHILDGRSATSVWLEPWRELARTIAFKPEHVFVSRRLVRVLRGGGRLCVYMPPEASPDTRDFRLYRAVARIALRADARVVPIHVAGNHASWFGKLTIRALKPATIQELVERTSGNTSSGVLYERVAEARAAHEKKAA